MPEPVDFDPPVGLHNCDREPIHIPGSVQAHGVLLAFDREQRLVAASENAAQILQMAEDPPLGAALSTLDLGPDVHAGLARIFAGVEPEDVNPLRGQIHGLRFDAIVHRNGDLTLIEFEPLEGQPRELDTFAVIAHRAMAALQRQRDINRLLATAVDEVHTITGFDRVMAYRFRPDGTGEVVAERHREGQTSYLGLRYPATDIPAQARRLYVLNPLRLIADVAAPPSALRVMREHAPIDQSQSTLRSVSPIHIEYLGNMGVGASMSVSIVVEGRLWGLIACHHLTRRMVPYTARMACLLLAQSLEMLVERAVNGEKRRQAGEGASIIDRVHARLDERDDLLTALTTGPELLELIQAGGFAASKDGRIVTVGETPPVAEIAGLVRWLDGREQPLMSTTHLAEIYPPARQWPEVGSGLLVARYSADRRGYLFWFRPELRQVVRWGGKPEKRLSTGPNGPRLTPRGSFDEWRQAIRGRSEAWSEHEMRMAEELRRRMVDVLLKRAIEVQQMRDMFIGILGHDLRNPLAVISTAARMMSTVPTAPERLGMVGKALDSSSKRMARLVDQMLEFSRLRSGQAMRLERAESDLAELVDGQVAELSLAFPGSDFEVEHGGDTRAHFDPDRLAQVVSNLISNARHHGAAGRPIRVAVRGLPDEVHFEVHNEGEPIPAALMDRLFAPFKRAESTGRNSTGLGLGLYITHQIVSAHGGHIDVTSDASGTLFRVRLPRRT